MEITTKYVKSTVPEIALSPALTGIENSIIRALFCATDYGVLLTDVKGKDIVCNPRFGEIFDSDPETIVHSIEMM